MQNPNYKKISSRLIKTKNATLYKSQRKINSDRPEDISLNYLIKEYNGENAEENSIYEYHMTTAVENDSRRSITIPILEQYEENGKYYTVRQYRHQGYFLCELIEELEQKMEEKCGRADIPFEIICVILEQILLSLEALHTCENEYGCTGYVHLDIHPGNIFLENCRYDLDREKISIGSAKFIDFQQTLCLDEKGMGERNQGMYYTEGYTAPEVRNPRNHRFGVQSDLYSVAAIGYRMLYGKERTLYTLGKEEKEGFSKAVNYRLNLFLECGMQSNLKYRYTSARNMWEAFQDIKSFYRDIKEKNYFESAERVYRLCIPVQVLLEDDEFISRACLTDKDKGIFEKKFRVATNKLKAVAMTENKDPYRDYYVFKVLMYIANMHRDIISQKLMFEFTANGIRICNNSGNTAEGIRLYEQMSIPDTLDMNMLELLLSLKNLISVTYFDHFAADKTMAILREAMAVLEARKKNMEKNIHAGDKALKLEDELLGKIYAAYASYGSYALLEDRLSAARVKEYFEKALNEFTYQPFNKRITTRRLCFFAIDQEDRELYEKYADMSEAAQAEKLSSASQADKLYAVSQSDKSYAASQADKLYAVSQADNTVKVSLTDKFTAMTRDALKNNDYDFALFNFLKAVYTFYLDEVDQRFVAKLCDTLEGNESCVGNSSNILEADESCAGKRSNIHVTDESCTGKCSNNSDIALRMRKMQNKKPYHLIYKYAALILHEYECRNTGDLGQYEGKYIEYMKRAVNIVNSGKIISSEPLNAVMISNYVTEYDFNRLIRGDDGEMNQQLVEALKKHAQRSGFSELAEILDRETNLDKVVFCEKR